MPGDLCQQSAGHPFDAEGEGCVLDRLAWPRSVSIRKKLALFSGVAVQQVGHPHLE